MAKDSAGKRRLVFLTVNSSYSHSSLALPLLHSACRDLPWEWFRYDMTLNEDVMGAVSRLCEFDCDLLVTTLYLFNRQTTLEILQRFHTLAPQCRIAAGGPECLGDGGEALLRECPYLDRVFRGEGEMIFREYLEHFDDGTLLPGRIIPADGNGVYQQWSCSPYPVDDPFFVTDKPFVQMESSRGCPMKCFYCTSGGTAPRYRSMAQVREELLRLQAGGVKEIRMLDRTFNLPRSRGRELLRLFREEFPDMRFHLELHPQFLDDALKEELLKALPGQLHIEAGIQCLDQTVQDLSGRRSNVEAALDGLAFLCRCPAFETHADLLAGLPGQNWQHILADTESLMNVRTAEIQLEVLKILPGTPLRKIAPEYGIKYSSTTPYDVMKSDTMSLEEIRYARDLSRLLDMTYNHKNLHPAVLMMNEEAPGVIRELLEYFHSLKGNSATLWDLKKRFLFLDDFCRIRKLTESSVELAWQWLLAGFPPGQGPDLYSEKVPAIPSGVQLRQGTEECRNARESRFLKFLRKGKVCYLAFNRSFALNLPAAVWF